MIGRRGFITGLVSLVAAPAIVRAGSLMPVRAFTFAEANPVSIELTEEARLFRLWDANHAAAVERMMRAVNRIPPEWLLDLNPQR